MLKYKFSTSFACQISDLNKDFGLDVESKFSISFFLRQSSLP